MTTEYDRVLYPSLPVTAAHPDRLGVIAHLYDVKCQPVDQARVLELGCGDGTHLIPMAIEYPESEFVGIDLASVPVNNGNEVASRLGLRNLRLYATSVTDLDQSLGEFDYVLAHGLYSWVPGFVQEAIFKVCSQHLTPEGLAYISYNAYPGGYVRQMVRSMMRFHTRPVENPPEKLRKALGFVAEVANFHPESDIYEAYLRDELKRNAERSPDAIYHDELADVNTAEYVGDFMAKARPHGLQFLGESDYYDNIDHGLSPEAIQALDEYSAGDRVIREQYRDIFRNRKFRQTILCREGREISSPITPDRVRGLWISTTFSGPPTVNVEDGVAVEFKDHERAMTLGNGFIKAIMAELGEAIPKNIEFEDLFERASRRAPSAQASRDVLADFLLTSLAMRIVEFRTREIRVSNQPGPKPSVTAYARLQASISSVLTTQRHTSVVIDGDQALCLIQLLDGSRDRAALVEGMREEFPNASIDMNGVESALRELTRMSLILP